MGSPVQAQGYAYPHVQPSGLGGFMQGLLGQSPPVAAVPQTANPMYPQSTPLARMSPRSSSGQSGERQKSSEPGIKNASSSLGGGLRTMCVRVCDGYYWPMTFNARRSRLDHDAKVCASSCATEARLFTMPDSGEAKDMIDQQGRSYVKLANAFKYRKTAGACGCRADPWEAEARARHETFAEKAKSTQVAGAAPPAALPADDAGKKLTIADAEALSLSVGAADAGPPADAQIEALLSKPAETAPPMIAAAAILDETSPKAKVSKQATTTKPSPAKVREASVRTHNEFNPEPRSRPQAQRVRLVQPYATPTPYMAVPGRGTIPAGYGRQPYVIIQPQGTPYRMY